MPRFTLNENMKGLLLGLSLLGSGASLGVWWAQFRDVPSRLAKVEILADSSIRLVTSLSKDSQTQLCIKVAEKRNNDWQSCFVSIGTFNVLQSGKP